MKTLFNKQREFVNKEFARATIGKHISNNDKTKILKKLWKIAKKKFKS